MLVSHACHTLSIISRHYFLKDFGTASQLIYTVQTTEGLEISEHLSELTDIIEKIKKNNAGNKKDGDREMCKKLVCVSLQFHLHAIM